MKRKKLKPLPVLKRNLWSIFSEYIRRRYADSEGFVSCISCGAVKHWKEMHAGHYIPKSLGLSVYFDERNVHPQDAACNTFKHGNLAPYAVALRKRYGDSILEELDERRHRMMKFSRADYEEMIALYKQKLNSL